MSRLKVVIIGGGSVAWTPRLAVDFFMNETLEGGHLVLVDIDRAAAELLEKYCRMSAERVGSGWTVEAADIDTGLDGADGVCVSLSTGGFEAMNHDYTIPEQFGIYHAVSDTVGPGGISRTLRNVPVFVDIARKMEEHCPDTWMVHVTNPLAQLTRCVWKSSGIRCLGLCHNYTGTRAMLARLLEAETSDIFATTFGVNHFTWLSDITCRGKDVSDRLTLANYLAYEARRSGKPIPTGTTDDDIAKATGESGVPSYLLNFRLYERLGVFPVGAASHIAEAMPFYLNSPEAIQHHRIRRKGVLPVRHESKENRRKEILDIVEGRESLPEPEPSAEGVAPIIVALNTGEPTHMVANLPNEGQIPNLPRDAVVETWALATWDRILPVHAGPAPRQVAGMLNQIVDEEELAVEAALTGDRDKVVQAMHVSPLVQDKDRAPELADALIEATLKWLPQFQGK